MVIAIEGLSLASYILPVVGRTRGGVLAAAKYFVFGTLGSVYLVWGATGLYSARGDMVISTYTTEAATSTSVGLGVLLLIGLLIKMGAAPVHQWVPDVYSGSPLHITFLFSTFIKAVLLVIFWRLSLSINSGGEVEFCAVASLVVGCFYTLRQKEVKRFLAYSSIVHMGFLLAGDIVSSVFYLLVYIVALILFFTVLVQYKTSSGNDIVFLTDLRYLNIAERPLCAISISISALSMAGMPPFGGFFIKL
jgi:NADH-quinone oxidoreductase subunit N